MTATATETKVEPRLGVYHDLAEADYHADPTSVSATGLKKLLISPAHYQYEIDHPGEQDTDLRDAFDLGTVVHSMVLGRGLPYVAVDGNRNNKAVKEKVAKAEAEGNVVLKPKQLEQARAMADAVLTHDVAGQLLEAGEPEVSMFWQDPDYTDDDVEVIRRCRWDWLCTERSYGVDLKTTVSSSPKQLARTVLNLRYDLSAAYYLATAAGLGIDLSAFALIWVEKTPPYPVVVTQLSGDFLERGDQLARIALSRYRHCVETGEWPAYLDHDFTTLHPPAWATDPTEELA